MYVSETTFVLCQGREGRYGCDFPVSYQPPTTVPSPPLSIGSNAYLTESFAMRES